jgi:hypothetical protein
MLIERHGMLSARRWACRTAQGPVNPIPFPRIAQIPAGIGSVDEKPTKEQGYVAYAVVGHRVHIPRRRPGFASEGPGLTVPLPRVAAAAVTRSPKQNGPLPRAIVDQCVFPSGPGLLPAKGPLDAVPLPRVAAPFTAKQDRHASSGVVGDSMIVAPARAGAAALRPDRSIPLPGFTVCPLHRNENHDPTRRIIGHTPHRWRTRGGALRPDETIPVPRVAQRIVVLSEGHAPEQDRDVSIGVVSQCMMGAR